MNRNAEVERKTRETNIRIALNLDGQGQAEISTGVAFFDHMLTLFAVHGFFDLSVHAEGDLEVDLHHTVEDVGLVLGDALIRALGARKGIRRYGHAVTPMDETLAAVTIDLSNRPFLVYRLPELQASGIAFNTLQAKEFFRALAFRGAMNLHIQVDYGQNEHHVLEAIFKSLGRCLNQACSLDNRIQAVRSSKGSLS